MKIKLLLVLGLLTTLLVPNGIAQGAAFTYQGRFTDHGTNYTGTAEFQPTLWDAAAGGTKVADHSPVSLLVNVSDGLFTLPLDFGATPFANGSNRWLQLEVRTVIGPFTALSPRQPLTPTPYAIAASGLTGTLPFAQMTGTVQSGQLSGAYAGAVTFNNAGNSFSGSGAGLTGLNAGNLASGTVPDARLGATVARTSQVWLLGGNAGTTPGSQFLGTTDNQALEFKVNGARALRLEDNGDSSDGGTTPDGAPNVIGGSPGNYVAPGVVGATIAGGGATNSWGYSDFYTNVVLADFGTVGGGMNNRVESDALYSTVSGGLGNYIAELAAYAAIAGGSENYVGTDADFSTIGGGYGNQIATASSYSSIGGGNYNYVGTNSDSSSIGGGYGNRIGTNSTYSFIGGGWSNSIGNSSFYATIPGGFQNAAVSYAFAAGCRAKANHTGSFVWADSLGGYFVSTDDNQFLIRANGGVGIGLTSPGAQLAVSSSGGDVFPQVRINQADTTDYARLRFTVGGDYGKRWDLAARSNVFVIYSGQTGTEALRLENNNAYVNGALVTTSDRNAKENFKPVNPRAVLDKVAALPLREWTYRTDADHAPHLGPMAQDFHAAFGLGADDKHIATVDADGVALAAIQGLNQKVEEKNAEIRDLKRELEQLKQIVDKLANH